MNKESNKMKEQGNHLIVKHNYLVDAKGKQRYTKNELKLVCNLVANITPFDKDFETKRIPIKSLGFILDGNENHTYFNKAFQELMAKPFKVPGSGFWVNWFSAIKYEDGFIEYRFDKALKPFLMELKGNFTKYRLKNILNLSSSYSIHIYELLASKKDKKGRSIFIEDFREMLNIPKSYTNSDITRMLNKAQKDLEKNTDIKFNFAFEKEGRKFNKINFKIMHNKKSPFEDDPKEDFDYLNAHNEHNQEPISIQDTQENTLLDYVEPSNLSSKMKSLRLSND